MRLVGGVEEMKKHILALATLISFGDWEQYSDVASMEPKVIDIKQVGWNKCARYHGLCAKVLQGRAELGERSPRLGYDCSVGHFALFARQK